MCIDLYRQCATVGYPPRRKKSKGSAIDGRTTRHPRYKTSLIIRKRIEEIFGWAKTVTFAAYNLTRMAAILGWRWSTA